MEKVEHFEIIDKFRVKYFCNVICVGFLFLILCLAAVMMLIQLPFPNSLIGAFISIGGAFFMMWVIKTHARTFEIKGLSYIRSFIINDEEIRVIIPKKIVFQIFWEEFNSINIKTFKAGGTARSAPMTYDEITFIGQDSDRTLRLNRNADFHKRKIERILSILIKTALKKNKLYNYEDLRSFY